MYTDCGRLFRRNRQAINVDKSRCRQLLQQEKDFPRPSPHTAAPKFLPVRKSLNFLEEWKSAPRIIVPQPPAIPAVLEMSVPENEVPEDFMEAFHGFEDLGVRPLCVRPRGRPRRSQSTCRSSTSSCQSPEIRSSSTVRPNLPATRSGRSYGVFPA